MIRIAYSDYRVTIYMGSNVNYYDLGELFAETVNDRMLLIHPSGTTLYDFSFDEIMDNFGASDITGYLNYAIGFGMFRKYDQAYINTNLDYENTISTNSAEYTFNGYIANNFLFEKTSNDQIISVEIPNLNLIGSLRIRFVYDVVNSVSNTGSILLTSTFLGVKEGESLPDLSGTSGNSGVIYPITLPVPEEDGKIFDFVYDFNLEDSLDLSAVSLLYLVIERQSDMDDYNGDVEMKKVQIQRKIK